jgi:hypothetical protein
MVINDEFSQHADMTYQLFLLKNNFENSRKIYYNPLHIINGEFSQQVDLSGHIMSRHISQLKNNFENYRKNVFFVN